MYLRHAVAVEEHGVDEGEHFPHYVICMTGKMLYNPGHRVMCVHGFLDLPNNLQLTVYIQGNIYNLPHTTREHSYRAMGIVDQFLKANSVQFGRGKCPTGNYHC